MATLPDLSNLRRKNESMKIRIRKSDSIFSLYVRTRDKWTCQRCKTRYPEKAQGLHNSHYWGRGKESTRFEPLNCDALCMGCHQFFGAHPHEYAIWKRNRLGDMRYDLLKLQAHTYKKRDDVMDKLYAQKLLNEVSVDNSS